MAKFLGTIAIPSLVIKNANGNFSANRIKATLDGTSNGFTGSLEGDVIGNQGNTSVISVGGKSALNIARSSQLVIDAVLSNGSVLVSKDSTGKLINVDSPSSEKVEQISSQVDINSVRISDEIYRATLREDGIVTNVANEISRATEVETAIIDSITSEIKRATIAETNLSVSNQTLPDSYTSFPGILAPKDTIVNAISYLDWNIKVHTETIAAITAANQNTTVQTLPDSYVSSIGILAPRDTVLSSISHLDGNIGAEIIRATEAETALVSSVTTERNRATDAETVLVSSVTTERNRAIDAETVLVSSVTTERNRAIDAETVLVSSVTTERNRAIAAELIGLVRVTGTNNTSAGQGSYVNNTSGNDNTVFGHNSFPIGTGTFNTVAGSSCLSSTTTGSYNSAFGYGCMQQNTTGISNVAVGFGSLQNTTTGSRNTGIGLNALNVNTIGNSNTAIGFNANLGTGLNTLYNTTIIGANASVSSIGSIAIGYSASASGGSTTAIGNTAIASGLSATAIGYGAIAAAENSTAIGNGANTIAVTDNNIIQLGNAAITTVRSNGTFTSLSDARSKTNIRENIPGIEFIKLLRPVTYNNDPDGIAKLMKIPEDRRSLETEIEQSKIVKTGFIAQEVEAAAKAIGYDFNGVDVPTTEDGYYSVAYSQFVVPLVQTCKQQHARINTLEATIQELLNRVSALESK